MIGAASIGWRVLVGLAFRFVVVTYVAVATFPREHGPVGPGLEQSWVYALNYLATSPFLFGRDVVYTYGPLGYVLYPLNIGANVAHAATFWVVTHGLFWLLLVRRAWRARESAPVLVFAAMYMLAFVICLYLSYSLQVLIILGLLLVAPVDDRRLWPVAAVVGGAYAGVLLYMKLTLGLATLAMLGVASALPLLSRADRDWRPALVAGATYVVTVALLAAVLLRSVGSFAAWLGGSLAVASGYDVAMSLVGPVPSLWFGLIALAIYVGLSLSLRPWTSASFVAVAVGAVPMLLAFKQGFVRQDAHEAFFAPFLLGFLGVVALVSRGPSQIVASCGAFLAILVLSVPTIAGYGLLNGGAATTILPATRGIANLKTLGQLERFAYELDSGNTAALAAIRAPDDWLGRIRRDGGTVDVLPWEIMYVPANDLSWRPNPVLQTYVAYTAELDARSAAHYAGPGRPDFLLVEFADIDGRNPWSSQPATWRAVLENYDIAPVGPWGERLLLERRRGPAVAATQIVGEAVTSIGRLVTVPPSASRLYVEIGMRLRPSGVITKSVFRIAPVYLTVAFAGGRAASFRITPDTARNGILMNFLPTSMTEMAALFRDAPIDRVVSFSVGGPGAADYEDTITLTWRESELGAVAVRTTGAVTIGADSR